MFKDTLLGVRVWASYNATDGEIRRAQAIMKLLIKKHLFKYARKHVETVISLIPYNLTGRWALEISFSKLDLVTESVGFSKSIC